MELIGISVVKGNQIMVSVQYSESKWNIMVLNVKNLWGKKIWFFVKFEVNCGGE